jgi:hypothetical protein
MKLQDSDGCNAIQSSASSELVSAVTGESVAAIPHDRQFQLHCEAGASGRFEIGAESLSLRIGQRIFQEKSQRIWDSVVIHCTQDEHGSLLVKIDICNPAWDEPLQIASLVSRAVASSSDAPPMSFDLTHKCE